MMQRDRDPYEWPIILRVLIGSQAHGLADENSDTDYREVFVTPTDRLLAVGVSKPKDAWSADDKAGDDEAGWEVAKIIHMAMHGHPNSVEVFYAPDDTSTLVERDGLANRHGRLLRALAPNIIPRELFVNGALGYANNCKVKLLQGDRRKKWAATYLRSIIACKYMLKTGVMPIRVDEGPFTREEYDGIVEARAGDLSDGYVIDWGDRVEREIKVLGVESKALPDEPNIEMANEFIREIRRDYQEWTDL